MFRLLKKKRSADSMDSSGKGNGIFRTSTGDANNFMHLRLFDFQRAKPQDFSRHSEPTGSRECAPDDGWIRLRDLAARCARVVYEKVRPGGRGECRVPSAPAASCAKVESTRVVTTSSPGSTRHSRTQWFYGLFRALPGDRAFLPPSSAELRPPT
jgi:hypothetical protein